MEKIIICMKNGEEQNLYLNLRYSNISKLYALKRKKEMLIMFVNLRVLSLLLLLGINKQH